MLLLLVQTLVTDGRPHGKGKLKYPKNGAFQATYKGEFVHGKIEGKGTYDYGSGYYVEEGTFRNGKLVKGTKSSADGDTQEGTFNADGKLIKGKIIDFEDNVTIVG